MINYNGRLIKDRRRARTKIRARVKPGQKARLGIITLGLVVLGNLGIIWQKGPDQSLGWNTSAKKAEAALASGRLGEARTFIDEAKETMPDHVLPFLLESRLGLAEKDMDMARLSAKAGLKRSADWHSDLVLARVLAETGDKQGAAEAAMNSFVNGASIGYLPEIAQAQISIGHPEEAERLVTYGRRQKSVRTEGFARVSGNTPK